MSRLFLFVLVILFACARNNNDKDHDSNLKLEQKISSFNFYGNYIPTTDFLIKDHIFNGIEIDTHDSLGGSFIKGIYLRFTNTKDDQYYIVDTSFKGNKDDFLISARDPLLGNLEIKGKFFGEKGPVYDDPENSKAIVFEGTFFVDGKNIGSLDCTYFEGD